MSRLLVSCLLFFFLFGCSSAFLGKLFSVKVKSQNVIDFGDNAQQLINILESYDEKLLKASETLRSQLKADWQEIHDLVESDAKAAYAKLEALVEKVTAWGDGAFAFGIYCIEHSEDWRITVDELTHMIINSVESASAAVIFSVSLVCLTAILCVLLLLNLSFNDLVERLGLTSSLALFALIVACIFSGVDVKMIMAIPSPLIKVSFLWICFLCIGLSLIWIWFNAPRISNEAAWKLIFFVLIMLTIYQTNNTNISIPTGSIIPLASTTIPEGYIECDGSVVSSLEYPELCSYLGNTWGIPPGNGLCVLPNLSRRVLVHRGGDSSDFLSNVVGSLGGHETHTLSTNEIPPHQHKTSWGEHFPDQAKYGYTGSANNPGCHNGDFDNLEFLTSPVGGGQPHNNMQPSAVVLYAIKY